MANDGATKCRLSGNTIDVEVDIISTCSSIPGESNGMQFQIYEQKGEKIIKLRELF